MGERALDQLAAEAPAPPRPVDRDQIDHGVGALPHAQIEAGNRAAFAHDERRVGTAVDAVARPARLDLVGGSIGQLGVRMEAVEGKRRTADRGAGFRVNGVRQRHAGNRRKLSRNVAAKGE